MSEGRRVAIIGTSAVAVAVIVTMLIARWVLKAEAERAAAEPVVDRCLQSARFDKCMELLPAGPQRTQYNDWDEVVEACHEVSTYQSLRDRAAIAKGCR